MFDLNNVQIEYDYICSIEGDFEEDNSNYPFVITYDAIEDKNVECLLVNLWV